MNSSDLTKAQNLLRLSKIVKKAEILPLYFFNFKNWQARKDELIRLILHELGNGPFIVRSSSVNEDNEKKSNAGAYLSLLNIEPTELETSIQKVFNSFGKINPSDEVLIQPHLNNVILSGVGFTHDPQNSAPYFIINYSIGNDTTAITGGDSGEVKIHHASLKPNPNDQLASTIELLHELKDIYKGIPVDCEFAITNENQKQKIWLLQARPLALKNQTLDEKKHIKTIEQISNFAGRIISKDPFLLGDRTIYGVMPDWNPAEIIGICPKPLAFSSYKELVTDSIWAYQRSNYGYRNLRSYPLILNFGGKPYVDVRVSFNSFIPADLNPRIGEKLVNHYIDMLIKKPNLHDKVEFDIVLSCYDFDIDSKLQNLEEYDFYLDERESIKKHLHKLTNQIINPHTGLYLKDIEKIQKLKSRYSQIRDSELSSIDKVYWLIEDAKRYGTLPFAGLARCGFIAMQLLNSISNQGIFSQLEYDEFLSSLSTVSSDMQFDKRSVGKNEFLQKYGHLRPGTYDITSPRYDEDPSTYFDWNELDQVSEPKKEFSLTLKQMSELKSLIKKHKLEIEALELLEFIKTSIEAREWAKFYFSRNLSDAFSLIVELGEGLGIAREDLAYLDLTQILELRICSKDIKKTLLSMISAGKQNFALAQSIKLPPLICNLDDFWSFSLPETTPNFITNKEVTGKVAFSDNRNSLKDAIVFIPNADPGFDWLFSNGIAGLITEWGGVNSHMAIRANELGVPAVIGAGEKYFKIWSKAKKIHLDCSNARVELIQ